MGPNIAALTELSFEVLAFFPRLLNWATKIFWVILGYFDLS